MGKSLPSTARFQDLARIIASDKVQRSPKHINPRVLPTPEPQKLRIIRVESEQLKVKMEESSEQGRRRLEQQPKTRLPLSAVVSDCAKRWFEDTLKEARAGDSAMQVLVGQMYYSGYGIPRDIQKARAWISKASKSRSSVWLVSDKHPGYNASDSDSDDLKDDS